MLANLRAAFEKPARTRSFTYELRGGASDAEIESAEERLGLRFPPQVRALYAGFDGLKVEPPALEIFSVVQLERDPETLRLAVAKVYGLHTPVRNRRARWHRSSSPGSAVRSTTGTTKQASVAREPR